MLSAIWHAVAAMLLAAGVNLVAQGTVDVPHRWPLIFFGNILLGASVPAITTAAVTRRR